MSTDRAGLPAGPAPAGQGHSPMASILSLTVWPDPDLSYLDDRRGDDLPAFPIDVLTPVWRQWLAQAADGAGVAPDHVAVPLLAMTSGLIGAARLVRASPGWSEPLAVWTAVVGWSGSGKTPGLDVGRRALSRIEGSRKPDVQEARRASEQLAAKAKAAFKRWKADVEAAVDAGGELPPKPPEAEDPEPFVAPRFFLSDVTPARLAPLLRARQRGMIVICDELSGHFISMGRFRAFWLEAWCGAPFVVERVTRPPVAVNHLLVAITGGFQPDRLGRAFSGDDDGMYSRVLFAWPAEPEYKPLPTEGAEIDPAFLEALKRLVSLDAGEGDGPVPNDLLPREMKLSKDATKAFEEFRQRLHAGKAALDGREREWWAKGGGNVLRLAGTLAYLSWAWPGERSSNGGDPFQGILKQAAEPTEIGAEIMGNAIRLWHDYFWPHARAALRQVGVTDRHRDARRVLRWVRASNKLQVSREDVRREALGRRLDAEQTQDVLDKLVGAGWLRPTAIETGGRAARRWIVNPRLFQQEQVAAREPAKPSVVAYPFPPFAPFPPPLM